jgi:hypothetical protein
MTLPDIIDRYLQAQDQRDNPSVLTTLAAGGASEYTFTRTLVSAEAAGADTWTVLNHIEGNFPGGTVDLRYEFTLADGLITELVIAP